MKEPIISWSTPLSVVSWSKIYSNYFLLIKQKLFRFNSNHAEAVTRYGAIISLLRTISSWHKDSFNSNHAEAVTRYGAIISPFPCIYYIFHYEFQFQSRWSRDKIWCDYKLKFSIISFRSAMFQFQNGAIIRIGVPHQSRDVNRLLSC